MICYLFGLLLVMIVLACWLLAGAIVNVWIEERLGVKGPENQLLDYLFMFGWPVLLVLVGVMVLRHGMPPKRSEK